MCNNNSLLIFFLILKVIILFITPIIIYFLYKKENKLFSIVGIMDVFLIILFIILRLNGNLCISNSNIMHIKENIADKNKVAEKSSVVYESIYSTKQYLKKDTTNAYYYSINDKLKDVKISCNKKGYMKNYGDSIAAITTLISNYYGIDLNEITIIKYLEKNNLIDCDNGIDFNKAINALGEKYYYNVKEIQKSKVESYVSDGISVLVETKNDSNSDNNFGCERDYIVIYNKNNDNNYNIINPNDKNYSYFCPSNTIGYGSIIKDNQNDRSYTLDEIDSKAVRYIVIEVD